MRTLVESSSEELVLVDGVKIVRDDGWVLVLPDPADPVTHVWAEGGSDADARALVQEYCRRIRHLMR
jgi:mannose-1-phosphate guanylyltransferase/phosphomannomutase